MSTLSSVPGVIVAENDAEMRGVIRSILTNARQQVFPVANGVEAINLARRFVARLVLLDIGMPHLNGLDACRSIHRLPGYEGVPIVMLTGYDDDDIRVAARRAGARDFITKPFRPDVLLGRLARYLDIPADLMVARTSVANDGTISSAPRARVWETRAEPVPAFGEYAALVNGRKTILICRGAQRSEDKE